MGVFSTSPLLTCTVASSISTQVLVKKPLKTRRHCLLRSEPLAGVCEQSSAWQWCTCVTSGGDSQWDCGQQHASGCTLRAVSLQYALLHLTGAQAECSAETCTPVFSTAHQHAESATPAQQATATESWSPRERCWEQHVQTWPTALCISWISTREVCASPHLPSHSHMCLVATVSPSQVVAVTAAMGCMNVISQSGGKGTGNWPPALSFGWCPVPVTLQKMKATRNTQNAQEKITKQTKTKNKQTNSNKTQINKEQKTNKKNPAKINQKKVEEGAHFNSSKPCTPVCLRRSYFALQPLKIVLGLEIIIVQILLYWKVDSKMLKKRADKDLESKAGKYLEMCQQEMLYRCHIERTGRFLSKLFLLLVIFISQHSASSSVPSLWLWWHFQGRPRFEQKCTVLSTFCVHRSLSKAARSNLWSLTCAVQQRGRQQVGWPWLKSMHFLLLLLTHHGNRPGRTSFVMQKLKDISSWASSKYLWMINKTAKSFPLLVAAARQHCPARQHFGNKKLQLFLLTSTCQ